MAQYLRTLTKMPSAYVVSSGPALIPKSLDLVQLGAVTTRHLNPAFRAGAAAPLKIHSSYHQQQRKRNVSSTFEKAQSVSVLQSSNWDEFPTVFYAKPLPLEKDQQVTSESQETKKSPLDGKPSPEQLQKVHDVLVATLPHVFNRALDYRIFSPNVILVDNIRGKTIRGLMNYIQQVAMLRIVGHFKYAFVRLDLLHSSIDPLEGRVIVRWRIKGVSGLRVFLKFWAVKLWKFKEITSQQEIWHDGISYYDVGTDGLIHKHTLDKVEEDKDQAVEDSALRKKLRLASKLAGASSALVSPIIVGAIDNLPPL